MSFHQCSIWINEAKRIFLYAKKIKITKILISSLSLLVSIAPFWMVMNCRIKVIIFIFFAYKKYSRRFINSDWTLMADGVSWRCFSFFSGPWRWYLLASQWDSHKPPGSHLKYLKLCSEGGQSFYGVEMTCGWVNNDNIIISVWSNPLASALHKELCTHHF